MEDITNKEDINTSYSSVDQNRIALAIREILIATDEDTNREGLIAPQRVARAYAEIFSGINKNREKFSQRILILGIQRSS